MSQPALEQCIDIAWHNIENVLMEDSPDPWKWNWRWGLAEAWLRQAENLMRKGA